MMRFMAGMAENLRRTAEGSGIARRFFRRGGTAGAGRGGKKPRGKFSGALSRFLNLEADGIGTVEMVLLLVVIIALVVVFRDQIMNLINSIFSDVNSSVQGL